MNALDAVGLIINPTAGQGYASNARAARAALAALGSTRVYTGPGELGARALENDKVAVLVIPSSGDPGRAQTQALARALAQAPLAAILVVGGDGTLADAACALAGLNAAPPLLGIGVGSTNAGSLITCRAVELDRLDPARLQPASLRALLAYAGGELLGIGFNDCVLGFSLVGTIDGVVCDVDAAAKLSGETIPGVPKSIGTRHTLVQRIGPDGIQKVAAGPKTATVILGFAERAFFAKAVTGGVCLAALVDAPAGCLVADTPLVQIGLDRSQVLALPPIHSAYSTLDETQRIRVRGVRAGTAVCVDGNPLKLLQPEDSLELGVALDAVQSLQLV